MKKIVTILLCATLLTLCISGCTGANTPVEPENTDTPSTTTTTAAVTPVDETLKTAVYTDIDTAQFTKLYEYGDDEIECYVVWCDAEMTDFSYQKIGCDAEGAFSYDGEPELIGTVAPGEAVVLKVMVPEGYPCGAIEYSIGDTEYAWALGYNGDVGGLSFVSIDELIGSAE